MSTLIRPEGTATDAFTLIDAVENLSLAEGAVLVPLEAIDQALAGRRNAPVGLLVPNDVTVGALQPYLSAVQMIAVAFPAFSDGRGLSLARRLRRAGFDGTLRARGPLIADQFAEALACGFDEVELPDASAARQPERQWLDAKEQVSANYQTGYAHGRSILQQRTDARKAAS